MSTIADIKKTTENKMTQSLESLRNNLQKIRTGRAHPSTPVAERTPAGRCCSAGSRCGWTARC